MGTERTKTHVRPEQPYIQPTFFADVRPGHELWEEIFRPVLVVSARFSTEEEVVQMANDTKYGLAAAVHTSNIDRALRLVQKLEAGTVWVDQYGRLTHQIPMGGYKESGLGRDLGSYALAEYTQVKAVQIAIAPLKGRL